MTSVVNQKFALKPVVAALALATAAGVAYAAPTPNQMPGAGTVTDVSLGSATVVGTNFINVPNGTTITVDGKVIITWGGPGAPAGETTNPYGFNLGSNAVLGFTSAAAGSSVLNIDRSGNPSQLYGLLIANTLGGFAPSMFVSNANGIVVGAGGRIVAPNGVGLIGAEMWNGISRREFVADNGWVIPAPQALGVSYISYGASQVSSKGNVDVGGAINGDFVMNVPAQYVLLAGNNVSVMNTGNVFGKNVTVNAGLVATADLQAVAGLSNQTVNRLWNVNTGQLDACCDVDTYVGSLTLVGGSVTGNVTNEGSISAAGTVPNEWIQIQAAGNIRSGILGNTDNQKGLFSDQGIFVDSFSNTSTVELYNVLSGYTTNKTLPFLAVNLFATLNSGFRPDVTLEAITPGAQPSSITTTDEINTTPLLGASVMIFGDVVNINSTINHKLNSAGGTQGNWDLVIDGNTVNVKADVGAGRHVYIVGNGPVTVSGNVLGDTNEDGTGGVYVYNNKEGATTLISGMLHTSGPSTSDVGVYTYGPTTVSGSLISNSDAYVTNNGTSAGNFTLISGSVQGQSSANILQVLSPANAPITIEGTVSSGGGNVNIANLGASAGNTTTFTSSSLLSANNDVNVVHFGLPTGLLTAAGTISAGNNVNLFSDGNAVLGGMGITAGSNINTVVLGTSLHIDGPWMAGTSVNIASTLAQTKLNPSGILAAPAVNLIGLSFQGVNSSWMPYALIGEKPAFQITTNALTAVLGGSLNAPIAGNTNWLLNSIDVAPLFPLLPVLTSISANGGTFQAVNVHVLGDMIANSGTTATPFIGVPLTSGGLPAGGLQGNLGSQLILQSDGYMQVLGTPTLTLFGPPLAFQWPGGAVFKAGTTLQTFAPIYNAWSTASPPYGGLFFEAPYISLGGYLAVSGTAWANFSTQPVTGDPTVYQIRQLAPSSAFGFEATDAFVKNAYSNSVTGGFVCTTLGATTWTVCP